MPSPEFGPTLNRLMAERDISQGQLAAAIGAHSSDVGRWRKGLGISITNVRALADQLGEPRSKWERLAGYATEDDAPESDAAGGPVLEIHGELSEDQQQAIEALVRLDPAEIATIKRMLRGAVPPLNPQGGKPPIRIFVRHSARDGAYKHPFASTPRSGLVVPLHAGRRAA